MPAAPLRVDDARDFADGFAAIREKLDIAVEHPAAAVAEAEAAAARGPSLPAAEDLRGLPFVTIDPPGSRDLDQAVFIEPAGSGWVVHYAIADVAAFVTPGGPLDEEARRRGVTIYLPDAKAPLHPFVLSEGAASLLPGEDRQAVVWRIAVDEAGEATDFTVRRAVVCSRAAFAYEQVQAALDADHPDALRAVRGLGLAREQRQATRGGLDLRLPDQAVVKSTTARGYQLVYRAPLPVEGWNAQVSLLAGECAARLMVDAGVGVLRTLPPPGEGTVARLRRHAKALDVPWPAHAGYASFLRSLDPADPDHAALIVQSASLARGASYVSFTTPPSGDVTHSAVTTPYAHVTAPLRRLVDRFGNEVVLSLCAGTPVPDWVLAALPTLPDVMNKARQRERAAERMAVDLAESLVLAGCEGAVLDGVVVDVDRDRATVQLARPAVVADVEGSGLALGDEVRVAVSAGATLLRVLAE